MIAMTNQIFKLAGVVFTCAVVAACSADVENPPPLNSGEASAGDADFTTFVSVGDSLTAGYTDGTLYLLGQQNSFPAILANQFADVGGGAFEQPLTNDNLGGLILGGAPILDPVTNENLFDNRFVLNTDTETPERLEGSSTNEVNGSGLNDTAFNNMGVPAAKSFHIITPGYGDVTNLPDSANPYYVRFASTPAATARVIDDAGNLAPSFYTLWVGSNDVIWYGFAGGDDAIATDQYADDNFVASTYGYYDISHPAVVATSILAGINKFNSENPDVKGVVINIPDVTTIPYFTTVPYNPVPLDQATADAVNVAYEPYNAALQQALAAGVIDEAEAALRTIQFVEGQNAVVILDQDLTPIAGPETFMRQATANDLIPLEVAPLIGTLDDPSDPNSALGVGVPLEDKYVLIPSEIQAMQAAVAAYNTEIQTLVDTFSNVMLFDAASFFAELRANGGIDYGTGSVNDDFVTGGFFSLDGIHPTGRGSAVFSNALIDAINAEFKANVYKVDAANYPTVLLK
jgi:lysophospholipase L1-like esterase